jgi:hypothetical protein
MSPGLYWMRLSRFFMVAASHGKAPRWSPGPLPRYERGPRWRVTLPGGQSRRHMTGTDPRHGGTGSGFIHFYAAWWSIQAWTSRSFHRRCLPIL